MVGGRQQYIMAFRMHYNESSAPRYSRNPLSAKQLNQDSLPSSKKHSASLNQSFQLPLKPKTDPYQSANHQIYDSSVSRHHDPSTSSKPLLRGKENCRISKQQKISQLRKAINNDENSDHLHHKASRPIQASRASTIKTNAFLDKTYTQQSFGETAQEESMFSPKILNRSKSMNRNVGVSTLLFEDARRRQEKEQFMLESDRKQKEILMSPKINSNTNALVLRKIESEFRELVTEDELNPLIALSVLEELFNVNLNPHTQSSNHEPVQRLIAILTLNRSEEETKTSKLWQFIVLLIMGQLKNSQFSRQEEQYILQNYQYFYKKRVTKERKTVSPDRPTFRPKTLESSTKMAGCFRQKTCQQIDSFVGSQKITVNIKDSNYTIQDLFIIDHHKKLADHQRKKIEQDNKQLGLCTFKPDLSPSTSSHNITKQKPKIPLRATKAQFLKTQYTSNSQVELQKSTTSTKINPVRNRQEREKIRKEREDRESTLKDNVKDVEKVMLRMSVGRQKREFSNRLNERGYRKDENWAQMQRSMHRETVQNCQRLKGFKSK